VRVRIRRLELVDFRNYASFVLEPAEGLTILVGPNAVGKTNVVEAIELVTETSSFRNPAWQDLIRAGAERAMVLNHAETDGGVGVDIALAVENGRRTYRVNGTAKRAVAEAAGHVPAVVFTPDDLRIVKDGADRRRAAVDAVGTQVSRAYAQLKAEYERVLRQRNALLRSGDATHELLRPWTDLLARTGSALTGRREGLIAKLAPHVADEYAALASGEVLTVGYACAWRRQDPKEGESAEISPEEVMLGALRDRSSEEIARRTTLVGPHRDDIRFEIAGQDARAFASQGQQRTAALAWKMAELAVIEELSGTTPVLLLDDVMSELDQARRHALAERVGRRTQTIMTTTNLGYFDEALIRQAKIVQLDAGTG
jgi:DNA replication and repair protein RecF